MSWEGIVGIIGIIGSICAIAAFFVSRKNAAKEDGAREQILKTTSDILMFKSVLALLIVLRSISIVKISAL